MSTRTVAIGCAVAALAVPVAANAGSPTDRATGGGQTLVGTTGAGNTVAFTAQGTTSSGKGQVQVVDRSAGTGQSQVKFHGIVDCIDVSGNMAEIGGYKRDDPANRFSLYVEDNGEGAQAAGADMIVFSDMTDGTCDLGDQDNESDGAVALARGNAQVYDAP
jgi:hypothetical protein